MTVGRAVHGIVFLALVAFLVMPQLFSFALGPLAPAGQPVIYDRAPLFALVLSHLGIVAVSVASATVVAVGLAILVTRPFGAEFLPLGRAIANIGQTVPPVAVLALCVPVFGFGAVPAMVALFAYGLLPIFENALTALTTQPPAVIEAGRAMGMTPAQRLVRVELPLALPLILAGIRISVVIAISTAAIGSTVAAPTLGEVILAGLSSANVSFMLQGGLLVAALAVLIHAALAGLEERLARRWRA